MIIYWSYSNEQERTRTNKINWS